MEAIWDTAATPAVPLTLSEAHSQAALVPAVRSLEALTLVVRSLVALTVEILTLAVHEVVVAVTSEATDKQGYSSSVRTSAFDIL